jgi:hypothetical protein
VGRQAQVICSYYAILCRELGYCFMLVSVWVLGQIPHGYQRKTFGGDKIPPGFLVIVFTWCEIKQVASPLRMECLLKVTSELSSLCSHILRDSLKEMSFHPLGNIHINAYILNQTKVTFVFFQCCEVWETSSPEQFCIFLQKNDLLLFSRRMFIIFYYLLFLLEMSGFSSEPLKWYSKK